MTHNEWILKSTKEREAMVVALNAAAAGFDTIARFTTEEAVRKLAETNYKACRNSVCSLVA